MKRAIYILLLLVISLKISYAQCNGSMGLCSKQYNEVAYLTTHNAFNSDEDRLFFISRALDCQTQNNKFPNFVSVDYYELGDGLAVVDKLNGFNSTSSININEQNPERKLLAIKDMPARKTEVINNSMLLHPYNDGAVEKRIIVK